GFVAKNGAEGVFAVGTRSGYGICIKIADGNLRAAPVVALKLMFETDLITQEEYRSLSERLTVNTLGGKEIVGQSLAI
ncbi:MAG: asparaginase, partial [Microbacteriaceae bacterium]|nr:asparaginase [Microbacteriaceae bacterium]